MPQGIMTKGEFKLFLERKFDFCFSPFEFHCFMSLLIDPYSHQIRFGDYLNLLKLVKEDPKKAYYSRTAVFNSIHHILEADKEKAKD